MKIKPSRNSKRDAVAPKKTPEIVTYETINPKIVVPSNKGGGPILQLPSGSNLYEVTPTTSTPLSHTITLQSLVPSTSGTDIDETSRIGLPAFKPPISTLQALKTVAGDETEIPTVLNMNGIYPVRPHFAPQYTGAYTPIPLTPSTAGKPLTPSTAPAPQHTPIFPTPTIPAPATTGIPGTTDSKRIHVSAVSAATVELPVIPNSSGMQTFGYASPKFNQTLPQNWTPDSHLTTSTSVSPATSGAYSAIYTSGMTGFGSAVVPQHLPQISQIVTDTTDGILESSKVSKVSDIGSAALTPQMTGSHGSTFIRQNSHSQTLLGVTSATPVLPSTIHITEVAGFSVPTAPQYTPMPETPVSISGVPAATSGKLAASNSSGMLNCGYTPRIFNQTLPQNLSPASTTFAQLPGDHNKSDISGTGFSTSAGQNLDLKTSLPVTSGPAATHLLVYASAISGIGTAAVSQHFSIPHTSTIVTMANSQIFGHSKVCEMSQNDLPVNTKYNLSPQVSGTGTPTLTTQNPYLQTSLSMTPIPSVVTGQFSSKN